MRIGLTNSNSSETSGHRSGEELKAQNNIDSSNENEEEANFFLLPHYSSSHQGMLLSEQQLNEDMNCRQRLPRSGSLLSRQQISMDRIMKICKFIVLLAGFVVVVFMALDMMDNIQSLLLLSSKQLSPSANTTTTIQSELYSTLVDSSSSSALEGETLPNLNDHLRRGLVDFANNANETASDASDGKDSQWHKKMPGFVYSQRATIVPDVQHLPVDNTTKKELAKVWGYWHFWDGDEKNRPQMDYCDLFPNRDVPTKEFPPRSWQSDAVFVNHLIDDGEKLVNRALEAIFTEYGYGKPLPPDALRARIKMFRREVLDFKTQKEPPVQFQHRGSRSNGGWTTKRSLDGLVRRLLHAIMTNDVFTVVLVGHSAAAGHGNHFRQSYMMQFHKIIAPVLARFGVTLVTRNLAQGGLGTIQAALGASTLIGDNIDILLWDSGMTEPDRAHIDLLIRQAILGGERVPIIWGGDFHLLRDLHEHADVEVGDFGTGYDAIIPVKSKEQAEQVPYASRFMKCEQDVKELCDGEPRFCDKCWIPREDIQPEKLFGNIAKTISGQVKWHPGWRHHQLVGRTLAYSILDAMQIAVQQFSEGTMGGPPLDEVYWHVTDYYENIRKKVQNLDPSIGDCYNIADYLPKRMCQVAMKGASLFTPRPNPEETSILRLMRPAPDGQLPTLQYKVLYDGPDKHNLCFDPKEVDVLAIISGRRQLQPALMNDAPIERDGETPRTPSTTATKVQMADEGQSDIKTRMLVDPIVPGKGWVHRWEWPGNCDGTYDAICGRHRANNCPLSGHHDSRGFLLGNEESGWLVLDIPEVKNGIIVLKFETWHDNNEFKENRQLIENSYEVDFSLEDNYDTFYIEEEFQEIEERRRLAKLEKLEQLPETFAFDFAINGNVKTWNKQQFIDNRKQVQRVVETFTLLDDPKFPPSKKVEVAVRLRGCGQQCNFGLTHAYWS